MILIYIAGKYSGDIDSNIAAARKVAVALWDAGYAVLCPHLNSAHFEDDCKKASWDFFLAGGLRMLSCCDAMYLLPGWEESPGARIERIVAMAAGIPCVASIEELRALSLV